MSKISITEYSRQGRDDRGPIITGEEPALARQLVDFTAGATASAVLNANTRMVRVCADVSCAITFGAAPVAALTDTRIAAGQPEYFSIAGELVRQGYKISAIAAP